MNQKSTNPNNTRSLIKLSPKSSRLSPTGHLRALCRDERGMSTVEYVILLAVIVVGAVGFWNQIGTDVKDHLESAQGEIETLGAEE